MGKMFFEKKQISKNFSQGRTPGKEIMMITIEYSLDGENEFLTNVEAKLFEQTLFVMLRCGYLIKNVTIMKQ